MDRGPGLSDESLEHAFDKFYGAPHVASGGTSLGLSIAKGLVEAHGGSISVANRSNGGARFVIRVPLGDVPVKLSATEYAMLRLFVQQAGKVLTYRYILREVCGPAYERETQYC